MISTRGNAEGLLGFMTSLIILLVQRGEPLYTGFLLGFAVHFKIYPFIYIPTILLALDMQYDRSISPQPKFKVYGDEPPRPHTGLLNYVNQSRILFCVGVALGFLIPTALMYQLYGHEFLQHSYLHHFSRLDHRHNFSPYHLTLYLSSALPNQAVSISSLAFIPQLVLAGIVIPLALYRKDLATTMFTQTFAFVAFNKVCTSQVLAITISLIKVLHVVSFISAALFADLTVSPISYQGDSCTCFMDSSTSLSSNKTVLSVGCMVILWLST